jgi:hypothetical protein
MPVSLPLLIEVLPQFSLQGRDGILECGSLGRRLGIIRPSTRLRIQAPEIPQELLIPLPKDSVLCRQPRYHHEDRPDKIINSDKLSISNKQTDERSKRGSPEIEVHPQRDQIVALLLQREAEIKASTRQAKAKEQATRSLTGPTQSKEGAKARVRALPITDVRPDPTIAHPSWAHLKPLFASA